MKKLNKREKTLLYLVMAVSAGVLVFNIVLSPVLIKLTDLSQDIEKKEYLLRKYAPLAGKGEDIMALYDKYKDIFNETISSQEAIDGLFEQAEKQARSAGLNLEQIRPLLVEETQGYKRVLLNLETTGSFGSIFKFIDQMEKASPLINISSFRLNSSAGSEPGLRCSLTVSRIFFEK